METANTPERKKVIFSAIQPSGHHHPGQLCRRLAELGRPSG